LISPAVHPLWGIDIGGRTAVIYSPKDLSCYWNQAERNPANAEVTTAVKLGQNIIRVFHWPGFAAGQAVGALAEMHAVDFFGIVCLDYRVTVSNNCLGAPKP
jgi:hypothetical protein